MSDLKAIIDREKCTAVFSGPGTFAAKETIKSLGMARWLQDKKAWEVRSFRSTVTELQQLFPALDIEERGSPGDSSLEGVAESSPVEAPIEDPQAKFPKDGLSVAQLNEKLRGALKRAFPQQLTVYGVLRSVNGKGNRAYLELGEIENSDQRVSCVVWEKLDALCAPLVKAGFKLEPNLQVMFVVQVDMNTRNASVSLRVVKIVAEYTIAKVAALRELTNKRLKEEQLYERNKQLVPSYLPQRLGLLTSRTGTVIHDFLSALEAAKFGFELFWFPVSVQGGEAKSDLLKGLEFLNQLDLDGILVFRGGGSPAELAIFNDYDIARAVCLSRAPVYSAIGHEEDHTSVQDVSYGKFGVPKELGNHFANRVIDLRRTFRSNVQQIFQQASYLVRHANERWLSLLRLLEQLGQSRLERRQEALQQVFDLIPRLARAHVEQLQQRVLSRLQPLKIAAHGTFREHLVGLGHQMQRLTQSVQHILGRYENDLRGMIPRLLLAEHQLANAEVQLRAREELVRSLAPEVQLKRGFAIVRGKGDGRYRLSGESLKGGEEIEIQFFDRLRGAVVAEDKE